jgi:Tfp pilus assembly protein PilZ
MLDVSVSTEHATSEERRLFARFVSRFPTKLKDSDEEYGQNFFLRDVSAGGARIASRQRLFLEDFLSLNVELPDSAEPVCLNGRVRWVRNHTANVWEAGMEFHRVDLMRVHRIMKYSAPGSGI